MKDKRTEVDVDRPVTASGMECTGLMPTPPQDEAEYESYRNLYSMETPKEDKP
ncbi:MAG: hypothetical protein Q4C04_02715 [Clostridia bacterium]|nr:hypothetical protein [Clostridia bacterium]